MFTNNGRRQRRACIDHRGRSTDSPHQNPDTQKNRPWFFFRPRDKKPLFIGGIVGPDGFSILIREPVKPLAEVHDRA